MIALNLNFIENHLSFLKHQDSANTDLSIIKKISVTSFFSFFISFSWFNNISMRKYDDMYFKDSDNDES